MVCWHGKRVQIFYMFMVVIFFFIDNIKNYLFPFATDNMINRKFAFSKYIHSIRTGPWTAHNTLNIIVNILCYFTYIYCISFHGGENTRYSQKIRFVFSYVVFYFFIRKAIANISNT